MLRPLSFDIQKQESEVEAAQVPFLNKSPADHNTVLVPVMNEKKNYYVIYEFTITCLLGCNLVIIYLLVRLHPISQTKDVSKKK